MGERLRLIRAKPWPERPVSEANKSGRHPLAARIPPTYLRALPDQLRIPVACMRLMALTTARSEADTIDSCRPTPQVE